MGFPAIFYCHLLLKSSGNIRQIKYQMLVVVHKEIKRKYEATMEFPAIICKYMIQQYFTVTAPTVF